MSILVRTAGGAEIEIEHFSQAEFHEITGPYTKDGYSTVNPRMKWDVWGEQVGGVQRFQFDGSTEEFLSAFDLERPLEVTWEDEVLKLLVGIHAELVAVRSFLEGAEVTVVEPEEIIRITKAESGK